VAKYLAVVHRLRPGDRFAAFDPGRGLEADGEVVLVTASDLVARMGPVRAASLVARRDVTWIQAIPKGEKMDGIVRDATELGVTRIVPTTTSFTVVRLEGPKREARRQRWERIAREAARQCGRSDAPEVLPVAVWAEALAQGMTPGASGFCLFERADAPLALPLLDALSREAPLAFAAGPEGGLSAAEVAEARAIGMEVVSLGPFVLRAETVAGATLGALRTLDGLFS
jgi:16S rRNA (uracil1498-N3)-methyltransferase